MKYLSFVKSLFVNHNDELQKFVARKLGNTEDAEEIVQDTFHNFMRLENLDDIENPRAFLYKTANNLALNRLRKNKNHKSYTENIELNEESLSLEREIISQQDAELLYRHIEELPQKTKQIFLMNRIEAMSYPEIAEALGISVSGVSKHMMKALKYIRENLDISY